jgi:hypothetical protein
VAVHQQPVALRPQRGHVVEDVGQHDVQIAVVLVVGDVGYPLQRVRKGLDEPHLKCPRNGRRRRCPPVTDLSDRSAARGPARP